MSIAKMLKEKVARYIVTNKSVARTKPTTSKHVDGKRPRKGYPRALRKARKAQRLARRAQRGKR